MNKKYLYIGLSILSVILILGTCFFIKHHFNKENSLGDGIIELSQNAIKESNIQDYTVIEKPVKTQIKTVGQVKTNEDKKYTLNSMVAGRVIQDRVKLGDYVRKGQVVATVQNPEIVQINANATREFHENRIAINQSQTKYNLARSNYQREKRLYYQGISPKKDYLQAYSDMVITRDDVKNYRERSIHIQREANSLLGVYGTRANLNSESLISTIPIIALRSGQITKKNITVGSVVTPEQVLYEVSDLSSLWLDITLYSTDIAKVEKHQQILFYPDSYPGKSFIGRIDYIQPSTDEPSKTFIARTFIDNSMNLLMPGMFGNIIIESKITTQKPFIPDSAIQKYGKEVFVFYDLGNGKYKKQDIELGEKLNNGYFINKGLNVGDRIVSNGSFTLKAEMLKSQFQEED